MSACLQQSMASRCYFYLNFYYAFLIHLYWIVQEECCTVVQLRWMFRFAIQTSMYQETTCMLLSSFITFCQIWGVEDVRVALTPVVPLPILVPTVDVLFLAMFVLIFLLSLVVGYLFDARTSILASAQIAFQLILFLTFYWIYSCFWRVFLLAVMKSL